MLYRWHMPIVRRRQRPSHQPFQTPETTSNLSEMLLEVKVWWGVPVCVLLRCLDVRPFFRLGLHLLVVCRLYIENVSGIASALADLARP